MLSVRTIDSAGRTTGARIHLTASDGKFYAPPDAYARISAAGDPVFHSSGEFRVELPAGKASLVAVKGFEQWPQPIAWLWVGSQIDYHAGSITLALVVTFLGMIASLMITLGIATRLDRAWRILRRAAGHEQQEGMLPRIFAVTAIIALVVFSLWFWIIEGPAPTLAPR